MDKSGFQQLFETVLETAAQKAEVRHNVSIPRTYKIRFINKSPKRLFTIEDAAEMLYIDEEHFYYVIDLCVDAINSTEGFSIVTVIPSGHTPVPFEKTWFYSTGQGPFKTLVIVKLKILDE